MANLESGNLLVTDDIEELRTIPDLLDRRARDTPDKESHIFWMEKGSPKENLERSSVKFKQLAEESIKLASALLEYGLQPGDRIAVYGHPSYEYLLIDLATQRIKVLLIRLPESIVYSDNLIQFLHQHQCKILFIDPEKNGNLGIHEKFKKVRDAGSENQLIIEDRDANSENQPIIEDRNAKLENKPIRMDRNMESANQSASVCVFHTRPSSIESGIKSLYDLLHEHIDVDRNSVATIQKTIDPQAASIVFPTSGSTGVPKLVTHSQANIIASLKGVGEDMVLFNDRMFAWLGSANHWPIVTNSSYLHIDPHFTSQTANIQRVFQIFHEEHVVLACLPVYILRDAVNGLKSGIIQKPGSLQIVSTSGEGIGQSLRHELLKYVPVHISSYASTECNSIAINAAVSQTFSLQNDDITLYSPFPSREVKVVGDDGDACPIGTAGHILVRSPYTFLGYLDDAHTTSQVKLDGGWIKTGDIGILHPENKLEISGRVVDVITKGGCKIYPHTIERNLKRHPDVAAVYVAGVPDARYQEDIAACVVLRPGQNVSETDIIQWCKNNSAYSTTGITLFPQYIILMDHFPTLPSGKINAKQLKQLLTDHAIQQNSQQ